MTKTSHSLDSLSENQNDIVRKLGVEAKKASFILAQTPSCVLNDVLDTISVNLKKYSADILAANKKDVDAAHDKSLAPSLIDRLTLNDARIQAMVDGVQTVKKLDDPTAKTLWEQTRPNGLRIQRVSCPIGVLGMIYESRPNVTIDASVLSLKSHNAVILRGGSESLNSSLALHHIIQEALEEQNLPKACVSMIPTSDRAVVGAMLQASDYIDVMIPRGGRGLTERVMNEARMPVFSHLDGICHVYIHPSANADIARDVTLNAKMRRTGICGAAETLLLDRNLSEDIVRNVLGTLLDNDCHIVGDAAVQSIDPRITAANDDDWITEYLDSKISCKFVNDVTDAVNHINTYGSHHTESILAEDKTTVEYFHKNVDSGIVMHNASTQFADGGEFGMGAEIGIATGKMHARGPVGLEQLCTYKYLVHGNGQTRP